MHQFLGGVQLANNIQIHSYKNEEQSWLSLYKDDKFVGFVTSGPEISELTGSADGKWFAYFQKDPLHGVMQFNVWKCYQNEAVSYMEFHTPLDTSSAAGICFNAACTHVIALCEWNHVVVIDLMRLDAPTEFYIPNGCDEVRPQTVCCGTDVNSFMWYGQDEYMRVIDLTTRHPTMCAQLI